MALPHSIAVKAGTPLYRITSPGFRTQNPAQHVNVVNGQGAVRNPHGARYNYPGAVTVYLAEDIDTCLAEAMFYFQRTYLQTLDSLHISYPGNPAMAPAFQTTKVLWRIELQNDVPDVADLKTSNAGYFGVFPPMMTNPSQDYFHLKERRAHIQPQGYAGLRAPSSRSTRGGRILALFQSQSSNVAQIEPIELEIQLLQPHGQAFNNHTSQLLDFEACEVRATSSPLPLWATPYLNPTQVQFKH